MTLTLLNSVYKHWLQQAGFSFKVLRLFTFCLKKILSKNKINKKRKIGKKNNLLWIKMIRMNRYVTHTILNYKLMMCREIESIENNSEKEGLLATGIKTWGTTFLSFCLFFWETLEQTDGQNDRRTDWTGITFAAAIRNFLEIFLEILWQGWGREQGLGVEVEKP